jgi:small neutral amino acid transporter SnatA (MarC family)
MEQQLQAIATVLSLVNPMICGAMFAQIEAGQARAARLADATKAALAVLVILVVAALVGAKVLQIFGVSLDAFSVAEGAVLSLIGFTMLRANSTPAQNPSKESADENRSITPVILFAASPGTITGVITLVRRPCEAALARHSTGRSRGGHRRNVDRHGVHGPRGNSCLWRLFARHRNAVHGIDCRRHGCAVRSDWRT